MGRPKFCRASQCYKTLFFFSCVNLININRYKCHVIVTGSKNIGNHECWTEENANHLRLEYYTRYLLKTCKYLYCQNFPKETRMNHHYYGNFHRIQLNRRFNASKRLSSCVILQIFWTCVWLATSVRHDNFLMSLKEWRSLTKFVSLKKYFCHFPVSCLDLLLTNEPYPKC